MLIATSTGWPLEYIEGIAYESPDLFYNMAVYCNNKVRDGRLATLVASQYHLLAQSKKSSYRARKLYNTATKTVNYFSQGAEVLESTFAQIGGKGWIQYRKYMETKIKSGQLKPIEI